MPSSLSPIPADSVCEQAFGPMVLGVRIVPRDERKSAALASEHLFGFALPFSEGGIHATIFFHRTEQSAAREGVPLGKLLGHIIAHEIVIWSLWSNVHSRAGIMHGSWTAGDLHTIREGHLTFTSEEVQTIKENLARRRKQQQILRPHTPKAAKERNGEAPSYERRSLAGSFFFGPLLWSADRIEVGFCNVGQSPDNVIARAEAAASYVFGVIGIDITWSNCTAPGSTEASVKPRFVLRLVDHSQPIASGRSTPDAFGRAYLTSDASTDYAEVYYEPVRQIAVSHQFAEREDILGYAIAHELGHLLLGPRHTPNGIMSVHWNIQDLQMMTQHRMRFSNAQRSAMHREIQLRTARKKP